MNKSNWTYKKLGEVVTIERGGSPRPIQDYITTAENGLNWIKIGDAVEGSKYITSTKEKIKPEGLKKTRFVHKGDFILSNSMSFGRPYILAIDGCIHDGWLVLHDENQVFDTSSNSASTTVSHNPSSIPLSATQPPTQKDGK